MKMLQLAKTVQKPAGTAFRATVHGIKLNLYDGILCSGNVPEGLEDGMGMSNRTGGIDRAAPQSIKSSL